MSDSPDFQTMAMLFRNTASRFPHRTALVSDNSRYSYLELDQRTDELANRLRGLTPDRGPVVGVLLLDGLAMVELIIACAKAGATLLALNWRLAPGELNYILGDASPDACFVSDCFEDLYTQAGGTSALIVNAGDEQGALAASSELPAATVDDDHFDVSREDRWFMLYTSGTTGRPKGCQHRQGAFYVNVLSWLSQLNMNHHDTLLSLSPMFHVHGFATLLCGLVAGAKVVVPERNASPMEVLQLSVAEDVTVQPLWPFPTEYLEILGKGEITLNLKLLIASGGNLPTDFLELLHNEHGIEVQLIYGQTEVGAWATMLDARDQIERPKSCGRLMPHLQSRIVDKEGVDVEPGEVGELLVRGDTITTGYLNLPVATRDTITDGWLHTGDLFTADEDGFLYIVGREKELIKTGGENVYPAEVDVVLTEHPQIVDACIVGVADERWGEAVKAFVVVVEGQTLSRTDIVDWCKHRIAGYKRPRYIEFIDAIPRDFNQKPQRRKLAERETTPDQAI